MQDALWVPEAKTLVRATMADVRNIPHNGLTAVGSFSGCGGSSLGLKMAGWKVAAAIEFIPAAAETYRANFPETHMVERDIRKVTPEELLEMLGLRRGELDLFEGSPPCSSFSSAGMGDAYRAHVCKRCLGSRYEPEDLARELAAEPTSCRACGGSGLHDGVEKKYSDNAQRTDDLFAEWIRLLAGLLPRAFVAENVPGMLSGSALEEYAHVTTAQLGALGYRVGARVLNSANFGVPQERKRLIFLGYRDDLGIPPVFPAPTASEAFTTEEALATITPGILDHDEWLADSSMEGKAVGRTWEALKGLRDKSECARCQRPLTDHEYRTVEVGSVKKAKGQKGAKRTKRVPFCEDGEKGIEVKDYFLLTMPKLDRPCPTLTATGAGVGAASVVHPTECRKFTPAEAKVLCGFPEDFILTGTREQRYERMGRAVTPPMYEAVGRKIAEALS